MTHFDSGYSDLKLANFEYLRECALNMLYADPLAQWSPEERRAIYRLCREFASTRKPKNEDESWTQDNAFDALARDLDETDPPIPKWVCLTGWLSIGSLRSTLPELVGDIAKKAVVNKLH